MSDDSDKPEEHELDPGDLPEADGVTIELSDDEEGVELESEDVIDE